MLKIHSVPAYETVGGLDDTLSFGSFLTCVRFFNISAMFEGRRSLVNGEKENVCRHLSAPDSFLVVSSYTCYVNLSLIFNEDEWDKKELKPSHIQFPEI